MKKSMAIMKNKKGETITEMLVSVLIGALATAMLATTISYSIRTLRTVDAADEQFRSDLNTAQSQETVVATGSVTFPIWIGGSQSEYSVVVPVNYYGNERLMTFKPKTN